MNRDALQDGALAACTACAVQLGLDPMLAPVLAALFAVVLRYVGEAVVLYAKSRRRAPPS